MAIATACGGLYMKQALEESEIRKAVSKNVTEKMNRPIEWLPRDISYALCVPLGW